MVEAENNESRTRFDALRPRSHLAVAADVRAAIMPQAMASRAAARVMLPLQWRAQGVTEIENMRTQIPLIEATTSALIRIEADHFSSAAIRLGHRFALAFDKRKSRVADEPSLMLS